MTVNAKRAAAYVAKVGARHALPVLNDSAAAMAPLLACPADRSYPLAVSDGGLRCRTCGRAFPIADGVVQMLRDPVVPGDLAAREMRARDARAFEYDHVIPRYVQMVETEAIMRRLAVRPGHLVLDAGAGTGKLTHAAAAAGAAVLAVDFSVASLHVNRRKARRDWRIHLVAGDIRELPARPEAFDRVVCAQVIEHVPDPADRRLAVELMRRALKPGGRLVLTAYNYTLAGRFGGEREGLHAGEIFFHRFTAPELRGLFDGFEVEELCDIRNLPTLAITGLGRFAARVDHFVERLPWSRLAGDLLLVVARRL